MVKTNKNILKLTKEVANPILVAAAFILGSMALKPPNDPVNYPPKFPANITEQLQPKTVKLNQGGVNQPLANAESSNYQQLMADQPIQYIPGITVEFNGGKRIFNVTNPLVESTPGEPLMWGYFSKQNGSTTTELVYSYFNSATSVIDSQTGQPINPALLPNYSINEAIFPAPIASEDSPVDINNPVNPSTFEPPLDSSGKTLVIGQTS